MLLTYWKQPERKRHRNCLLFRKLWEKIVHVIEKYFWNSRLKAENLQNVWYLFDTFIQTVKSQTNAACAHKPDKVHIFWEGHKILQNLSLTFDCMYCSQKLGEDFLKFRGLLRIYELYYLPTSSCPHSYWPP